MTHRAHRFSSGALASLALASLALASLVLAPLGAGCAQLVFLDTAIIGSPDVIERERPLEVLCDDDVVLGDRAGCDVACTVEPGDLAAAGGSSAADAARAEGFCEGHLRSADGGLVLDASGAVEVEITLTLCPELESEVVAGPTRWTREEAVVSSSGEGAPLGAFPARLPEEECGERTVVLQDHRLELVEAGERLCSARLPALGDRLAFSAPSAGAPSLEICIRREREVQGNSPDDAPPAS